MDINNKSNYKKTGKKKYNVYVCAPRLGTKITNVLEGNTYITDENKRFVISGTVGELWAIDLKKLLNTYKLADGKPLTQDYLNSKIVNVDGCALMDWICLETLAERNTNWAMHVPKNTIVQVQTSWGDVLTANRYGVEHAEGDFIVCTNKDGAPNLSDRWVVNGAVFKTTYDMRAFHGFSGVGESKGTPVPKSIL